jgi:hypothetical protein
MTSLTCGHHHMADCDQDCAGQCGAPGGCKDHKHCTSCNGILCHRGLWYRLPQEPYSPGTPESAYAQMVRAQAKADRWRDVWEQTKAREAEMKAAREAALQESEDRRAEAFQKVFEDWVNFRDASFGPSRAVLTLHQPKRGDGDWIECTCCIVQDDTADYAEAAEWPCETYKVMKEAVTVASLVPTDEVWLTEADEEPKGGTTVQNEAGDLWSRPAHGYAAWTPCWFSYTTNEALRWMDLCQGYGPVKVVDVDPEEDEDDD